MNQLIPAHRAGVPAVTRNQMRLVDRLVPQRYGITLLQMTENAGRALAVVAREVFLEGDPRGKRVVVMAGTGGNGGGGLVCARRLAGWGATVELILTKPIKSFRNTPRRQLDILKSMSVPIGVETLPEDHGQPHHVYDLLVDALIGYNLQGSPRGIVSTLIHWANNSKLPILAVDLPSGVDATEGTLCTPAITAYATVTLALPKTGILSSYCQKQVGDLYLADIGIPPELYLDEELGFRASEIDQIRAAFATGDIVYLSG